MKNKQILSVKRKSGSHWVGDGFPVNTLLSYDSDNNINPFLLLDYAGPAEFAPSSARRGVGMHPHRGFETVTIVYQGEVEHKDTAGNAGKIGPGDVQWMTAARGVLHEEFHSLQFTQEGGMLEMIQLWVNLPAKYKMSPPRYQEITNAEIPRTDLTNHAGTIRIIAGQFGEIRGPAKTFTPINLWDLNLAAGAEINLEIPNGYHTAFLIMRGEIVINNTETLTAKELAICSPDGDHISLLARENSTVLVLNGEPIDEPVTGYGPFVMNTEEEIRQAIKDFNDGNFLN